jgi:transcription elongation factor Elf1
MQDSWETLNSSSSNTNMSGSLNPSSDYVAFDVSPDRQVYALAHKNKIRIFSYQSSVPRGMLLEAFIPASSGDGSIIITDIRFAPVDGSIYATVRHSDALFRCDVKCPDASFFVAEETGTVLCQNPQEQRSWQSAASGAVTCVEWSLLHGIGQDNLPYDYFMETVSDGYSMQGGCQIFRHTSNTLMCASGTFRSNPQQEAARVWLTNVGAAGAQRFLRQSWTAEEFGQLLCPPAINRMTKVMYLFSHRASSASSFSIFQVAFNDQGSRTSDGVQVYSHTAGQFARMVGCSARVDWNKLVAVDESTRLIHVFQLPTRLDQNQTASFRLLSSTTYGNAAYKDVEFVADVKNDVEWSDVQGQRSLFPSKLFLVSMEVLGNARAELYVQCAPCKSFGMTDSSRPALSQADCTACQPGFYKLANNSGCVPCKPCRKGEFQTGQQCSSGTDIFNVACMACRRQCSAGAYINGTCLGSALQDETNCPLCNTAQSSTCAVSQLPESRFLQSQMCTLEDCLRRQAFFFPLDVWDLERDLGPKRRHLVPKSLSSRSAGPGFSDKGAFFNASNHEYYVIPPIDFLFSKEVGYRIVSNVSVWEQGMTLSFWIRFQDDAGQWQSIIELSNGFETEHIYVRRMQSSAFLVFGVSHSMGAAMKQIVLSGEDVMTQGLWRHIAWTILPISSAVPYEALWNIYVDGQVKIANQSGVMPIDGPYTLNYVGYGTLTDLHSFFRGSLDDLRLYERAFTSFSVQKLFQNDVCCGLVVGSYVDTRRTCSGSETFDAVRIHDALLFWYDFVTCVQHRIDALFLFECVLDCVAEALQDVSVGLWTHALH